MTFRSWKCLRSVRQYCWILGASMRPWPFDHGNQIAHNQLAFARKCFNEAMTFRSWKLDWPDEKSVGYDLLQWGHDLSIMEMHRSNRWRRSTFGFNEAMTFRSWKSRWSPIRSPLKPRFNEAMTFRSWKSKQRKRLKPTYSRFNEAMTFRSWKWLGTL